LLDKRFASIDLETGIRRVVTNKNYGILQKIGTVQADIKRK
jgi:hypothetical protein